jgi:tRNA(Ile)-lysidine synthase
VSASLQSRVFSWLDQHVKNERCLALGYSGGGDSHALLCLVTEWAKTSSSTEICALIVDHGLRPESAGEAEQSANAARRLGARARVLQWNGAKPKTGVQAAARHARHELLAEAALSSGARKLLFAHTMDDQNETVWMRLQAGGGWRSCAGMSDDAPSPSWPTGRGVRLLRPLLNTRRASLRSFMKDRSESWVEDPSNEDPRYTRIAVRRHLAALEENGFGVDRLSDLANQLRGFRVRETFLAGRVAECAIELMAWGGARIDRASLQSVSPVIRTQIFSAAMLAVSGRPAPASKAVVAAMLTALADGVPHCGGGTRLVCWRGDIWLVRDLGAVTGRVDQPTPKEMPLLPNHCNFWDGRYEIETGISDICAGPLGLRYEGLADRRVLPDIPGAARPGLLTIRRQASGQVLAVAGCLDHAGINIRSLARERLSSRLNLGVVSTECTTVEPIVSAN